VQPERSVRMPPIDRPWRLAVVISHPTQYYSPWFLHLSKLPTLELKVFYLWDFGVKATKDRSFGETFAWDISLLEGYSSEFLSNRSDDPGTHHFRGLDNPGASIALEKWSPDTILMFGYNYLTHFRLLFSPRLAGIPFLFRGDSHELCSMSGWKNKVGRLVRRVLFFRFRRFLTVGKANADYFRLSGVTSDRFAFTPHCVDNERFQSTSVEVEEEAIEWKEQLGVPDGKTVILFAGKFEEKKRPLDLLEAFLQLPNHATPSAVLLFVGSGPLESELRAAAGGQTGATVFFAPFQNQSAMPRVYAAGDLFVLPSHGRAETWGLAVNEAMNLGCPAIVSSHVGCGPDLIVPGETGWIFEAGNIADLSEKLGEALSSPQRLREMGLAARQKIGDYSFESATRGLLEALSGLSRRMPRH